MKDAIKDLTGINSFDIDLKEQRVTVEGSAAPSQIVRAIQATGRDAIIRGTGKPNSAAVCILESFDDHVNPVKGLARIVSINPDEILIDLTMNGVKKGLYYPTIRSNGNLSNGALSTGSSIFQMQPVKVDEPSNLVGFFSGQQFVKLPLKIWELIGRSMVLSKSPDRVELDDFVGVIARSAGAWENDKQVCSCTGKTVWQERNDAHVKGIEV